MPKQPPRPERRPRPTGLLARVRAHLRTRSRGQSLVEFGLILPVFLLLLATTLDLGRLAFARVTVTNAAREGALQASKTPADFDNTQPCPAGAASNLVVCRVQLEARNSGVSIAPGDITLTCSTSGCPKSMGSRVTVSVTGHFTLLTPILAVFFGNSQNITFGASAINQIEALPAAPSAALATPVPSPTSTATASASASVTATPATCNLPSAAFTTNDTSNARTPFKLSVTDKSTSPNCAIQSWLWTWGDGTTTLGQTPGQHNYNRAGTYIVTLKVTNAAGSNTTGGLQLVVN